MKKSTPSHRRRTSPGARRPSLAPRRRDRSPWQRLQGLESLEGRQLLAANVLDSETATLASGASHQDVDLQVALQPTGNVATFAIRVMPTSASTLDPTAPVVMDLDGSLVSGQLNRDDFQGISGATFVTLPAGDFRLRIASQPNSAGQATAGEFQIEISLVGDVGAADQRVDAHELLLTSAAVIQGMGGGNFVTQEYYRSLGIDLSHSLADPGMDADGDGQITGTDLAAVEANTALQEVDANFIVDNAGPVFGTPVLINDTGISNADRLTTDPSLSVTVQDDSGVASILATLDGGGAVDVTSSLDGSGSAVRTLTLDGPQMDALAGGSLGPGAHTIQFTAADTLGNSSLSSSLTFTLIVDNQAPAVSVIPDASVNQDAAFSRNMAAFFSDPNPGDVLTYSGTFPSWLTLTDSGSLSGTPANADVGTASVTITARDSQGALASGSFTIEVVNVNDPPLLLQPIPDQTADEDTPFTLDFGAFFSDPDVGDVLTFSVVQADGVDSAGNIIAGGPLPGWLTADEVNGTLSGTPTSSDAGTFGVAIVAVDGVGETATAFFQITVTDVNDSPLLVAPIPDQTVDQDQAFALDLSPFFVDEDANDVLTFSIANLPGWLTLNSASGLLTGTPGNDDVGGQLLTATATDLLGASASDTFLLTVNNVNDSPVVADQSFRADPTSPTGTVVGTIDVNDPDVGDSFSFTILTGNDNAAFVLHPSTGQITVANANLLVDGTIETLTVRVTDSGTPPLSDTATITINITSNLPPVANDDSGFSVNDNATLTLAASELLANDTDPDGDLLTVSSVSDTSAQGASVQLLGTNIIYDPRQAPALAGLNNGETVTDSFTYTVSDGRGGTDSATVQVVVDGVNVVAYTLEVLDSGGNVITTIAPNTEFTLVAYVQDVQPSPQGVFSAFIDVDFTASLATVVGSLEHASTYSSGTSGSNSTPGVLDEVGGVDGISPLGGDRFELFRQQFRAASTAGTIAFTSNATENQVLHPTLVFGDTLELPAFQIAFGSASLTITGSGAALSSNVSFYGTNHLNPLDVNADTYVSPLDALMVINTLHTGLAAQGVAPDVNADGRVSPLDALLVINELVAVQTAPSGEGAGNVLVGADADVAYDDLVVALEWLFEELDQEWTNGAAVEEIVQELSPSLMESVLSAAQADPQQRDLLWSQLADELAQLLSPAP